MASLVGPQQSKVPAYSSFTSRTNSSPMKTKGVSLYDYGGDNNLPKRIITTHLIKLKCYSDMGAFKCCRGINCQRRPMMWLQGPWYGYIIIQVLRKQQAALTFADTTHQTNPQIKRKAQPFPRPTVISMRRWMRGEELHWALKRKNEAKDSSRQKIEYKFYYYRKLTPPQKNVIVYGGGSL